MGDYLFKARNSFTCLTVLSTYSTYYGSRLSCEAHVIVRRVDHELDPSGRTG